MYVFSELDLTSWNCPINFFPPDPFNHVKIFKGPPQRFVLWKLVPNLYKSFPPDHFDKIHDSTMLSHNTSTA